MDAERQAHRCYRTTIGSEQPRCSRWFGEAFGPDYELPNALAYTETCAAIGSIMWNWRMLLIEGDARYSDLIERTLYNAVLPGVSLDGETYFYQNPLADEGGHRRQPWFHTACCPPNIARLLASLPGYFYSLTDDEIWVHLYAEGKSRLALPNGTAVELRQRTKYPWDGEIVIEVHGSGDFGLRLRVPGWAGTGATLAVNGQLSSVTPGSYAEIRREWSEGDAVELSLPMSVRRIESHPRVVENAGRTALARGPLLYSLEHVDNPDSDVRDLVLSDDAEFETEPRPDLLGGVVTLTANAMLAPPDRSWSPRLYRPVVGTGAETQNERQVRLTAIPYYAWANREPGPMRVWIGRIA